MTVLKGPEPVAEILRSMAGDPQVCGELVRAARTRSPELSRLTESETFSHVLAMVTAAAPWFAALDRVEAIDEQDFGAALLLGADRAVQGVPMTAVLRGVGRPPGRPRSSWTAAGRPVSPTACSCR
ncbi:hypothetical protein [Streptomyces sp. NPDC087212]|uniref:hypothetical protein n=1 Tax=Streptomyces sp. NPDC087212 TaxID=3365766 RepID=UPI0037F8032C